MGEIAEGTPAAKAGLMYGDILLAWAGEPLPDVESLRTKIQAKGPHPAKLQILRGGKPMTITITPEPRKPEPQSALSLGSRMLQGDVVYQPQPQAFISYMQNVPHIDRLYVAGTQQQREAADLAIINGSAPNPIPASDLTKKIDELTAQVQALTKAVESLKAARGRRSRMGPDGEADGAVRARPPRRTGG